MTEPKTTPSKPTSDAKPGEGTPPQPKNEPTAPPAEGSNDEQIKTYESALRKLLGLKDEDALDNLEGKIADYQNKAESALKVANERLVAAAINSLQGYDTKLLAKVMDMDKISVDEKGEVVGIAEAASAAAKEFPAVVVKAEKKESKPFHPIGSDDIDPANGNTMNDFIRHAAGR